MLYNFLSFSSLEILILYVMKKVINFLFLKKIIYKKTKVYLLLKKSLKILVILSDTEIF